MALKLTISKDEHASLPDPVKALYAASGDDFKLEVDDLPDPGPLRRSLENVRKELKAAKDNLSKYDGQDPEEFRKLRDKVAEYESAETKARGDFDSTLRQVTEKSAREIAAEKKRAADLENQLKEEREGRRQDRIKTNAALALATAKGNPKLLMELIKSSARTVQDKDGKEIDGYADPDTGEVMRNTKGDPMTIAEVLAEWKTKPEFAGAFEGTGASGGGTQASRNGANGNIVYNREDMKDPAKYRAARDQSAKEGRPFMIEGQANLNEG